MVIDIELTLNRFGFGTKIVLEATNFAVALVEVFINGRFQINTRCCDVRSITKLAELKHLL